jgi:hypothetical protein
LSFQFSLDVQIAARRRPSKPPNDEILHAIYSDLGDVSVTKDGSPSFAYEETVECSSHPVGDHRLTQRDHWKRKGDRHRTLEYVVQFASGIRATFWDIQLQAIAESAGLGSA